MDREEMSALVGAVKELASAAERVEDQLVYMNGWQAKIEGRLDQMDGRLDQINDRLEFLAGQQGRMESDLTAIRTDLREQLPLIGRRLDHHDRKLMSLDRRVDEHDDKLAGS